jgi:ribosomal protein S18 acetylase RimI-like enzyme
MAHGAPVNEVSLSDLSLRRATLADAEPVGRLVTELGYATSAGQMGARLDAILRDDDYETLVACDRDTVVGFLGLRCGPLYESDDRYGQIMAMVVAESHRQRGVGGQLIRAAEAILAERGVRILVVTTGNQRDRAHKFYERNGYTFTGRRYMKRLSP